MSATAPTGSQAAPEEDTVMQISEEELHKRIREGTLLDADLTEKNVMSIMVKRYGSVEAALGRRGKSIKDLLGEEGIQAEYTTRNTDAVAYTPIARKNEPENVNFAHVNGVKRKRG